jgi:hypothetical protein
VVAAPTRGEHLQQSIPAKILWREDELNTGDLLMVA